MENEQPTGAPSPPSKPEDHVSRGTAAAERAAEHLGDLLWHRIKRRPYLGVALFAGTGLALASWIGVGELAVAAAAGYAAYKVLRQNEPPSRAVREALQMRKELEV